MSSRKNKEKILEKIKEVNELLDSILEGIENEGGQD